MTIQERKEESGGRRPEIIGKKWARVNKAHVSVGVSQ